MDFAFTPMHEQFRQQVRGFFQEPRVSQILEEIESQGEVANAHSPELYKLMGARGWLGIGYPKEYGGQGATAIELAILSEEAGYYHVPMTGAVLTQIVGNSLIVFGTERQKQEYVSRISQGEILFCIGYSEPDSGSDLAALQTRAVRDGDDYVINGQKLFNSIGHIADHCFLATRTDPNAPKHKGISLFIVDMKAPGVTVTPLWTLGGGRLNQIYFDDVRVPKENLVGEENRGWYHVAVALDIERSGTGQAGSLRRSFEQLVQYTRETQLNGHKLSQDPIVQQELADIAVRVEVLRWLAYKVAWQQSIGQIPNYEASVSKLYGSELAQRLAHVGTRLLGLYGQLAPGSPWAPLHGRLEALHRQAVMGTIAAGTSEIQRNIIAQRGLGLPRA